MTEAKLVEASKERSKENGRKAQVERVAKGDIVSHRNRKKFQSLFQNHISFDSFKIDGFEMTK